jgi:hypothetical protein
MSKEFDEFMDGVKNIDLNLKEVTMSKLYTEEQLLNTIKSVQYYIEHYDKSVLPSIIEKHIKALSPIELPNDEDIIDARDFYIPIDAELVFAERIFFVLGAKWMRQQLEGGEDEK